MFRWFTNDTNDKKVLTFLKSLIKELKDIDLTWEDNESGGEECENLKMNFLKLYLRREEIKAILSIMENKDLR